MHLQYDIFLLLKIIYHSIFDCLLLSKFVIWNYYVTELNYIKRTIPKLDEIVYAFFFFFLFLIWKGEEQLASHEVFKNN